MTPKNSPREASRPAAAGSEDGNDFEVILEQVLIELASNPEVEQGVTAATDRIADFFGADSVEIRPSGMETRIAGGRDAELEVSIADSRRRPIGEAFLHAPERACAWADRHRRQLRIFAWAVLETLRSRELENELQGSQAWLMMAVDAAGVGTWDWDVADDRVRYLSSSKQNVRPFEVRETIGDRWFEFTHPEDASAARAKVDRAIAGDADEFSFVVRSRGSSRRQGGWRMLQSRGRVIARDESGRATRVMGTYEDVTEAMQRAASERARDGRMTKAAAMASLGALASSLAHEVNQPLTAIVSYLEACRRLVVKGTSSQDEIEASLERCADLARAASGTVQRFRDLVRREPPLQQDLDLPNIMRVVRDHLEDEALAARVRLEIEPASDPIRFRGDAVQLEQMLVNLVRNAIESFSGSVAGDRTVTMEATEVEGGIRIRVEDNGPGIADEVRDRLFEALTSTKKVGRGLGLVICRLVAELYGGQVRVERTGPDGTCMVVELPTVVGGCS